MGTKVTGSINIMVQLRAPDPSDAQAFLAGCADTTAKPVDNAATAPMGTYDPWDSVNSPTFRDRLSRAVSDSIPTENPTNGT